MVVFYGNEISIGLMLASWLFWTAVGSCLAGVAGGSAPNRLMAVIQILLAIALPGTIVALRSAKAALPQVPGEILGPGAMVLTSLAILSAFCMLSGALFTAGSRLYARQAATPLGTATGTVYLWEAAGSSAGGVLAGLILVRLRGSLEIAGLLGVLNLLAAASLALRPGRARLAAMAGLLCLSGVGLGGGIGRLEDISQQRSWRGFPLIATRNSVYGSLAVIGTGRSRSLYENGRMLFTVPDPVAAEEGVHYALLEHPAPRRVLLIGGGLNGSIAQAFRHPSLQRVDYVELDPAVLQLARDYFPAAWWPLIADPRVRVHATDGLLYLKTTNCRFDVIIVNLPDPQTAQLNRFYTAEFFEEAASKLASGGVLALRLTASENYISPELADFLRSIHKTLRSVFSEVTAIPGDSVHFFASSRPGVLATSADELLARLRARHLATDYVSEYFLPFRMSSDRTSDLEVQIRPGPSTPVNHDFSPIAYYFDVALWSSRFQAGYGSLFRALSTVDFRAVITVLALLVSLLGCSRIGAGREQRVRAAAAACTAAMGFTLIGLQILLLLAFQSIYGYVYQQLAILIGAFMAGMAFGSALALRGGAHRGVGTLALLQGIAALAPLALCGAFEWMARVASVTGFLIISDCVFPVLALLCGILGGCEFPLASRLFFAAAPTRSAGTLYALDLGGSCLGAILFSVYLVPVFGFFRTALLIALVNLAPALMAILPASPADPGPGLAPAAGPRTPVR